MSEKATIMAKHVMGEVSEFIKRATDPIGRCRQLTEATIWSSHGLPIWQAEEFVGKPHFYPVYRYKDLYSYSLLSLILLKGTLRLNPRVKRAISARDLVYYSGRETIDIEIVRLGGPQKPRFIVKDPGEYARRMADALREDVHTVEKRHPDFTNVILCGGKDSLNLLLLPWENDVLVASAPPNLDLVKGFIAENGLPYDVVELSDDDDSLINMEILANCCQNNLEHCRWGPNLERLSRQLEGKVIFWKGQLGDTFNTPYWRKYTHPPRIVSGHIGGARRVFEILERSRVGNLLDKSTLRQRYYFRCLWDRGAMWQGSHMSMMRQVADALVLSAYHGPNVREVVKQIDLRTAVQQDIRPLIGKYLHGSPVVYPKTNPAPPLSQIRKGMSHLDPFVKELSSIGVGIINE